MLKKHSNDFRTKLVLDLYWIMVNYENEFSESFFQPIKYTI